jgi:hypothetical protein
MADGNDFEYDASLDDGISRSRVSGAHADSGVVMAEVALQDQPALQYEVGDVTQPHGSGPAIIVK